MNSENKIVFDKKDQMEIIQFRRDDFFLIPFGIYFFWPILLPFFLLSIILAALKIKSDIRSWFPAGFLFLPYILILSAKQNNQKALFYGMILLFPIIFSVVIGLFISNPAMGKDILVSPSFINYLLGTDGLGQSILTLLIKGAVNIYLISVVSALIAIPTGIWMGLNSIRQDISLATSMIIQFIESIPTLVWMIILLTAYSFWQTSLDPGSAGHFLLDKFRPFVMGVIIGICSMPNIYRIIRDKVHFFAKEEFIDMARAHGVDRNRILWVHILIKNSIPDIVISGGAIPGLSILTLLNIDYFFTISSFQVGAARYASWTQSLLTPEARSALLLFDNIWLFIPASILIISTSIGCYLYGAGLKRIYEKNQLSGLITNKNSFLQLVYEKWEAGKQNIN